MVTPCSALRRTSGGALRVPAGMVEAWLRVGRTAPEGEVAAAIEGVSDFCAKIFRGLSLPPSVGRRFGAAKQREAAIWEPVTN